jgi:hypothetical protein
VPRPREGAVHLRSEMAREGRQGPPRPIRHGLVRAARSGTRGVVSRIAE